MNEINPNTPSSRFNTPAPTAPSRFNTPEPTAPSRFSTPTPAPALRAEQYTAAATDDDSLPAGRLMAAIGAGFGVGIVYCAVWLWITFAIHMNFSLIAIGAGYAIGFTMGAVAQEEHVNVKIAATILTVLFALVGVVPNFLGGSFMGIMFSILCVMLAAGAAMKATDSNYGRA